MKATRRKSTTERNCTVGRIRDGMLRYNRKPAKRLTMATADFRPTVAEFVCVIPRHQSRAGADCKRKRFEHHETVRGLVEVRIRHRTPLVQRSGDGVDRPPFGLLASAPAPIDGCRTGASLAGTVVHTHTAKAGSRRGFVRRSRRMISCATASARRCFAPCSGSRRAGPVRYRGMGCIRWHTCEEWYRLNTSKSASSRNRWPKPYYRCVITGCIERR